MTISQKDFSHCIATGCDRKLTCLRFTTPDRVKNQAYLVMTVSVPDVNKCRFFLQTLEDLL